MFSLKKYFFPYNNRSIKILTVIKRHPEGVNFDNLLAEVNSIIAARSLSGSNLRSYLNRMMDRDMVLCRRQVEERSSALLNTFNISERGTSILREGKLYHRPKSHVFEVGKTYRLKGDQRAFTIMREVGEDTVEYDEGYRYIDNFNTLWRSNGSYETANGRRQHKPQLAIELTSEHFNNNLEIYA